MSSSVCDAVSPCVPTKEAKYLLNLHHGQQEVGHFQGRKQRSRKVSHRGLGCGPVGGICLVCMELWSSSEHDIHQVW